MSTTTNLSTLKINVVDNESTFESLKNSGQVHSNELWLVEDTTEYQTGTITFSANMTNWSSTLRKFGRVCVLKLNATTTVARSSGDVMATLPVGFRPDSIIDLNTRLNNGSNGIIELGTDGTVKCMNSMSANDGYRAIITYIV